MTRTTRTIPAAYLPALTDALLMLYASKAETIYRTVARQADLADARVDVRAHRWRLGQIGMLLDQLDRSATPEDEGPTALAASGT